jgi:diguanylate cyclase (GGDEF)-like protein
MESQAPFQRATVVKNTALLLGWTILIGLTLRALVAREIEPVATLIGIFFALALFVVRRRIAAGAPAEGGAMTVVAVCVAVYTALSWTSDGFRGSIILAAPMVPLVTGLMLGKRACRNVTILMALILMFILTQHLRGSMQVDENFPEEIRYAMRAIILLLSLVAVNWITSYYTTLSVVPAETGSVLETRDRLTGLMRRAYIDDALEREFARARRAEAPISFLVAEVDNYTRLESVYGPQGAENCLLGVADALRYAMRRSSDALGRWSHAQLCILLNETPGSGAEQVGERFRELIETLDVTVDPTRTVRLTVSVGIGTAEARGLADVKAVVIAAEQALEDARESGGNRSVLKEAAEPVRDST